ncbi:hypothetical protein [Thalassobacillus sp. CUG 92003]|uniref:hypothetical protein n=1 Tax=Thalassobacillus sp. CUG 92003 TaxID=2736641 RepID=UPI0015E6F938|nr:hypothetical protein [Thalassobacillus sp. CUG 92003]
MKIERIKAMTYTLFTGLYVVSLFIDASLISYCLGCVACFILFISFKGAARTFQIISLIFLAFGIMIFLTSDLALSSFPLYLTSTALLLSLLYFLPFINHLMVVGGYDQELKNLLQLRTRHLGQLYYRGSLISYVLCLFVFFSAITIVQQVVRDVSENVDKRIMEKFSSQTILRAFALANVWSPIEIFIALTVTITGVQYFHLLPWALLFSITLLMTDWLIGWFKYRTTRYEAPSHAPAIEYKRLWKKIGYLFVMLFLFIITAFGLQTLLGIDYFNAVILLIFPFTLFWALSINQFSAFMRYNKKTWVGQVNGLQNFMLLFLSLGFFSDMFEQTALIDFMQRPLLSMTEWPLLLFITIQLISLIFSMIGVHPLVTISLMGTLIQPILTALSPLSLSIVLLTSTLASDAAGTFNTTVTMMSELTNRNPYRITKWNLIFAIWFGTAGSLLAWLLL